MRGALPVRGTRVPIAITDLRWPSWASFRIKRRSANAQALEIRERLARERRRVRRCGEYRPELGPWGWR